MKPFDQFLSSFRLSSLQMILAVARLGTDKGVGIC
jgi:hypothetical protein